MNSLETEVHASELFCERGPKGRAVKEIHILGPTKHAQTSEGRVSLPRVIGPDQG